MISIHGKGVSKGIAVGPLYYFRRSEKKKAPRRIVSPEEEWELFRKAQEQAIGELGELTENARKEGRKEVAALFEAHRLMTKDPDYEKAIRGRIRDGLDAETAVADTARELSEKFAAMENAYFQARAADVRDISSRIVRILSGGEQGSMNIPAPAILSADELAPSELALLDRSKILGIVTGGGSGLGHTAILARNMGIPAVIGVGEQMKPEYEGCEAVIDGSAGEVTVEADERTRKVLMEKLEEQKKTWEITI